MKAGIAEIDITPAEYGRLGRLIAEPTQVTGVVGPLHARAILLESAGVRCAILSIDMNFIFRQNIGEIREHLATAGELDPAHIMITCTHTHNSFNTTPWQADDAADYAPLDYLKDQLHALVKEAAARLTPCRVKAGSAQAAGMTQNRRPLYRDTAGNLHVGTHGPESGPDFVGVEGPVDDELKVLVFESPEGRCLGGLVNFAAHPTTMFSQPVYSSSYVGPLTEGLKAACGGVFGFLYGLSGNLCVRNAGSNEAVNRKIGEALARVALDAIAAARPVEGETMAVSREVLAVPLRRVTPAQVKAAKAFQKMNPAEVDERELSRALFGHDFIFHHPSPRHVDIFVNEILGTWEYIRRTGLRRPTGDIEVQVIRLGDTAIAGFACELFCEVKHALQSASPFVHTFFAALANGGNGYVPIPEAFAHGGYETCIGIASQHAEEACGLLEASALRQLKSLAKG